MNHDVRAMLDTAKGLKHTEQWRVLAIMTKVSGSVRQEGGTLMGVLAEYFGESVGVTETVKSGAFVCPHCGKHFETQQALVGHGPKRCGNRS